MRDERRRFVQFGAAALGLLASFRTWAAWPKTAFEAKTVKDALDALNVGGSIESSTAVRLIAPDIAENGTVVPVTVQTDLKNIESITLIAEKNPRALVATYKFGKYFSPPLSTRMKLGMTQNVVAIVKAQGKFYSASKLIKVTVGGCGG